MSDSNIATEIQPMPRDTGMPRKDVAELVKQDLEARISVGAKQYGERLHTFNGRDAIQDAYQEILDLAVYLRQWLEEQKELRK